MKTFPRNVSFLSEYSLDPAKAVRRQLEALWARSEGECKQSSKDAEERKYREAYNARHTPENDSAA